MRRFRVAWDGFPGGKGVFLLGLFFLVVCLAQPAVAEKIIETIAGVGIGDGHPATVALIRAPKSVTVDSGGNLFIADTGNHRIRRTDAATGVITTVAGNGFAGYSGDGGASTEARLQYPAGVAVVGGGDLFIADTANFRIRRVDGATGVITTVAGTGTYGYSGDGGAATEAQINAPYDVAVDSGGNLFIADVNNHRIRRVDGATGVITTVAGTGIRGYSGDDGAAIDAQLSSPRGVAADGGGNLFIADSGNYRIRRVDGATGVITTVAGTGTYGYSGDGGAATEAQINAPYDVAVDSGGNLFLDDTINQRIRRVDGATGVITTVAGTGTSGYSGEGGVATEAQLKYPYGVAVDSGGDLFIADTNNDRIRRVDGATGVITTVAGTGEDGGYSGDGGVATDAQLNVPYGVAVDGGGNPFIADNNNHRIRRIDAATGVITTVAGNGSAGYSGDGGAATEAQLQYPAGVAVDGGSNLFIADSWNHRIRRVDAATGVITTVAGNGSAGYSGDGGAAAEAQLKYPYGVAADGDGNLFIADTNNDRIRRVDGATGVITTVAGTGASGYSGDGSAATEAQLQYPAGVAVDGGGNLFIADANNYRIRRVDSTTGIITTVAGTGTWGFSGDGGAATEAQLNSPYDVAVDGDGNLFIGDANNHRIRQVDATGAITTVIGTGDSSYSRDGGVAADANLDRPIGVAVDDGGNLFIADMGYHIVRVVAEDSDGDGVSNYSDAYPSDPDQTGHEPTVTISTTAPNPTDSSPIPVTVTFSAPVTGFESADVAVGNGSISGFSGLGTTYTFQIAPITEGLVTVDVAAEVAQDSRGNPNLAAEQLSRFYDGRPYVMLGSSAGRFVTGAFSVTITFSEDVIDFTLEDIQVTGGTVDNLSMTTSNRSWTADITPTGDPGSVVGVSVAENSVTDNGGSGNTAAHLYKTYVSALPRVTAIAAGAYHTVALQSDGTVVAWGGNDDGQTEVPADLTGVTAIAAGVYHTVALKEDGSVVPWGVSGGLNDYGQTTVPAGLTEVTAIAAGHAHTVTLKSDGTVVAWGYNDYGQTTVPAGLTGVTAVAAGMIHTVALREDGSVVAWGVSGGLNDYGQTTVPDGLTGVVAIAAGWHHTVALKSDGTVVAWGMNNYGQSTVPAGLTDVVAIVAGVYHTVALKSDGTVVAWGDVSLGQTSTPVDLTGVVDIAAGLVHTVALKSDGTVVAWGDNGNGQTSVPNFPTSATVFITTAEDTPSAGVAPEVIDADEGDTHTFTILTQPAHGSAQVVENLLVYTPAANFHGNDSFTFRATDGMGLFVDGTATVTVESVNDIPRAVAATHTTAEDTPLTATLTATDADGDGLTFRKGDDPAHGSVTVHADGSFTYTPAANFHGSDRFTFKANDGTADSNTATVTITFNAVNDAPAITSPAVTTATEEIPYSYTLIASDADGDTLEITGTVPNWCSLVDHGDGTATLEGTPETNDVGDHEVSLTVSDSFGAEDTESFTIHVQDVTLPALIVSTLADGSFTNQSVLNVSGIVTDNGGLPELAVNGRSVSLDGEGGFCAAVILVEGDNPVRVVATDRDGNQTEDSRTIAYDPLAPVLSISAPADNSVTNATSMEVSGTVGEAGTVEVALNHGEPELATLNGLSFTHAVNLAPGLNTINLRTTDLAGDSSSAKRTVILDSQALSLAITEPSQDVATTESGLILKGTVSDALTEVTVTVLMDGQSFSPQVVDGTFEQALVFDQEKSYAVTVIAADEGGNEVSVVRNVIHARSFWGDVDLDGTVDVADALKALRVAVGLDVPADEALIYGDVAPLVEGKPAPDGSLNAGDALVILKKVVGLLDY